VNRRTFLGTLIGGAALALEEAIPFGRVWFFPQKIRLANATGMDLAAPCSEKTVLYVGRELDPLSWPHLRDHFTVGDIISFPGRLMVNPKTRKIQTTFKVTRTAEGVIDISPA
jgi:hypothetical protein